MRDESALDQEQRGSQIRANESNMVATRIVSFKHLGADFRNPELL